MSLRSPNCEAAFAPPNAAYLSIILLSSPIDEAAGHVLAADMRVANTDPFGVKVRHFESFEHSWSMARSGIELPPDALVFLPHAGVQVALGGVADPAKRQTIATWYHDIHAPDVLEVPGFAAALRFTSLDTDGRHLVVFLLDDEPAEAVRAIQARVPDWRAQGRTPAPAARRKQSSTGRSWLFLDRCRTISWRYVADAVTEGASGLS